MPVVQRLFSLLGQDAPVVASPADDEAYRTVQTQASYRAWSALFVAIVLMAVLWWPSDFIIFRGHPDVIRAFAWARGLSCVITISGLLLTSRVRFLRRHSLGSLSTVACLNFINWGYWFGELGGPSLLWFNFLPQVLSGVIIVSIPGIRRVIVTSAFAFSMTLGYFGSHPQYFSDPFAPAVLSCLVCSVLATSGVGFMTDQFRRQAFHLRLATERQSQALTSMNSLLEVRVAEQTAELRALTNRLESARESERTHIARELHDELGQELTALRLALKFTRLRHKQGSDIQSNLEDLEALLARTTATTRGILVDLRPRILDDLGLAAATEWLVERIRQRLDVPCLLELPSEELHLPDAVATTAFRILQEALTNVMRHARPSRVSVVLHAEPDAIELVVQDDGIGFSPGPAGGTLPGLGLVGMRERARAVGGALAVESDRGQGTTVRVRLPRHLSMQESA